MSSVRPGNGRASIVLLPGVVALTGWVTMLSWRGFSQDAGSYLWPLLLGGLLIAAAGVGLRGARLPASGVILAQAVLAAAYLATLLTGSPVLTDARWRELTTAFEQAAESSRAYAAPVPIDAPGIHPLMILLGLLLLLLMDAVACSLRRVPLAGLPLLAAYSLPTSLLADGVSWLVFALAAGGFLTMVLLDEDERLTRWGRALGFSGGWLVTGARRAGSRRFGAVAIGAGATALAVLVPAFVPTLQLGVFAGGTGRGGGDVSLVNPITDLRRDLQRGEDIPLLQITTDDPSPTYLRTAVLNRFTNNEWSSGNRSIPTDQTASGDLPSPLGVSRKVERTLYDYRVEVSSAFRSTWLPVMYPATRVVAEGDWRYDTSTMDFISADDTTTTAGLDYTMTVARLTLTQSLLNTAPSGAGAVGTDLTELPPDLPPLVRELAVAVAGDRPTKYQQAVALQRWFRTGGGFRYSLERATAGNGTDELLAFLDPATGRVGYCEQFASAMAVMARTLNIPARVAVGFLSPDRVGPDQWEYSAWDLHAWPELYFPGAGWVRFEPTPAGRADQVPPYTRGRLSDLTVPSAAPTAQPSNDLASRGTRTSPDRLDSQTTAAERTGLRIPWRVVLAGLGALAGLAGLLSVPLLLRRTRRDRRWARSRGPEAAWAELRDTMIDLGHTWPVGRSPRDTARVLSGRFGVPLTSGARERPPHGPEQAPTAVAALDRIVESLERARYARSGADQGLDLRADTETCIAALVGGTPAPARRRARWWPRSVFRPSAATATPADLELVGAPGHPDRVVDHVG